MKTESCAVRMLRFLFGNISWTAPPWLKWLAGCLLTALRGLRNHPRTTALTLLIVTGLTIGGIQWWRWWESHKPRELSHNPVRQVEVTVGRPPTAVAPGARDQGLVPSPLLIAFSGAPVAPLEAIGKDAAKAVKLKPEIAGTWTWRDGSTLAFQPQDHWAPDVQANVTIDPDALAEDIELDTTTVAFTTPPLVARVQDFQFYNSPKDPSVYQVVGTVQLSHPVSITHLKERLEMTVVGGTSLFTPGNPRFTISGDPDSSRTFHVRSRQIVIPVESDWVKLSLSAGLASTLGGEALAEAVAAKTQVPDKYSGLKIEKAQTRIIQTDDGTPQQFLFIETNQVIDSRQIADRIGLWWHQQSWRHDGKVRFEELEPTSDPVKLTLIEGTAPVSKQHAFRFLEPRVEGKLLLRIDKGVQSPGGFEINTLYEAFPPIPAFPKETRILGEGNILALHGERKLLVKSRGVDHLRVTLGRVPDGQLHHLVSMSGHSRFDNPRFSGDFNSHSLTRSWTRVIPVPRTNDWDANQSEIDLSKAPPLNDPESLPGGRGVFFVTVEPVKKVEEAPVANDIYSRIDWPSWENSPGGTPHEIWFGSDYHQPDDGWGPADGNHSRRFMMVTDLGLLVKQGADGARDVFVMSLAAGEPVPGVEVRLMARNGSAIEATTTDSTGHARLSPLEEETGEQLPVAVVARKEGDVSFLPLNERQLPAMDYSRFDIDGVIASRIKEVEAYVFTERGVYRPGDTLHAGVVAMRRDWQPVLEGLPLSVTLTDPRGREVHKQRTRLPFDGFFACDIPLSEASSLGVHQLEVHVLNSRGHSMFRLGRTAVRVEEFQPDTMKLATRLEPSPPKGWMDGRDTEAVVTVKSLFGEAAAERRVTMKLELSPARFGFEEWPGFSFHDRSTDQSVAGRTIELGETKTDEEGEARFNLPLGNIKDASYRVSLLAEAFERNGGRSVRDAITQLVSPHDTVVGWKADVSLDTLTKDGEGLLKLVAIGRNLEPVAVDNLRRRILEVRQVSALTKLRNGNYAYVSTTKRNQVSEEACALAAEVSDWDIPTAKAGSFIMQLVDLDGVVLCSVPYQVVGKGNPNIALDRDTELSLQLSSGEVLPGGEIDVHLTAPYAGAGLITIERDTVIASQWFRSADKATTVRLRIPEDAEGTYYINAAYIRGTSEPEVFHSPLSYAAAPVRVLAPEKKLELTLDVPAEVRPGRVVQFGIKADRPAKVIVYAVDEGIHNITNYQLPRPLDFFQRKQALEVRTQQWLDLLMPEYRFLKKAAAFGGDGGGPDDMALSLHLNPFKRRKEPPVVFWSGMVDTGPEGSQVSWEVPDYFNGNLRVMAVACRAGALGSVRADTLVKAPIILQPNTPLFVSPGDEFEVSLAVFNHLETPGVSTIEIEASLPPQLEAIGDTRATLSLEQGRESDVRFRLRAKDELGAADIRFDASGGGEAVKRSTSMSLRPATHHLTKVVTGWFRTSSTELKVTRTLYPQFRHAEATTSITPLGLARGLEAYVREYPYGCSEQITSRAMVKLVASTETDFGIPPAEAAKAVEQAIQLLGNRQAPDGGFGYWSGNASSPFEFHSLYVLHFLTEAKGLGHPVPEPLLHGSLRYAGDTAKAKPANLAQAELQAYAIYLLARNGRSISPQLLNLRDTLESKDYKGRWHHTPTAAWMAACYAMLRNDEEANALLDTCLKARATTAANKESSSYHSTPAIDELKIFYLQCREFPERAKRFGIEELEPVMKPLRDQSFNTLACSYMTLALKAYSDLAAGTGVEVSLLRIARGQSGATRLAGPSSGILRSGFDANTAAIRFERKQQGDGDIGAFYQVVEQGYDAGPPSGPLRSGLEVAREIVAANKDKALRPGDPVDVVLRVRNVSGRDLDNLAVVDLLPAGFEVVSGDLRSGAGTVPGAKFAELREDRNLFFIRLDANREWEVRYRMKAVCSGSFVVPAAMAEDMYDRGLHGTSKPARIEIQPAE